MKVFVEKEDTIVVALGGNAIIPKKSDGTLTEQKETTRLTMRAVARLIAEGHRLVLTHGNGPVVGNIVIRNEAAASQIAPMPLDVCVADSMGGIGYMIQQVLHNELRSLGIERDVITLITQVEVDLHDPAFRKPTKPIGPFYTEQQAEKLQRKKGWKMVEDAGRGWRRVVPSPKPIRIIEGEAVRAMVNAGPVVIAVGGGGIPVGAGAEGRLDGLEAVIDKDRTGFLLARATGAKIFAILTGVEKVAIDYGKPEQRDLDSFTTAEARRWLEEGQFPPGSMGPKIEAAIAFLERGGKGVLITSVDNLYDGIKGTAGTWITP
ncbi:MAG: carbamate kinase [Candidatus Eisenbacteria bacterium]|nr:carbamate kinase [Candidatus Eisenbacteria bacterium]